ncbi:MAG: PBP1A family penicillin-binding protein [Acidobacteriota bacterium]
MSRKRTKDSAIRRFVRRRWPWLLGLCVVALGVAVWLALPFWRLSAQFGSHPMKQPSRLYGKPPVVTPGGGLDLDGLLEVLTEAGYSPTATTPSRSGFFRRAEDGSFVEVYRRVFPSPRGRVGGDLVRVEFRRGRVARMLRGREELRGIWLDPPLLATYYSPNLQERRPVTLDELPEHLILAVLAAEDARFLEHSGVSPRSILRAAWVNFRTDEINQGGSTLTQQVVKNLYLTHERRLGRKIQEAILAVMLEVRYDKRQILQAYLNEIYWGKAGSAQLMGVGAASWAYFRKRPSELTLAESALLAGMIHTPGRRSPFADPEKAKLRRDEILGRLSQLNWVAKAELQRAAEQPVRTRRGLGPTRRTPFFAEHVQREVRERFGVETLADAGYTLCGSLELDAQKAAQEAVEWGLESLETGWEKGRKTKTPLEAALVSIDPADGSILAYVGGRDYARSQFDRVTQAARQAGSAFKPIVYAAAFERREAHPATYLEDAPYTVQLADQDWSPQNSDGEYLGRVTSRQALEKSLNVPTARLAVRMGLEPVVEMAQRLGIRRSLRPYPALALGAMEVTPLEMATVYATLASGGVRHQPHGVLAVFDREGRQVPARQALEPTRVLERDVAFLVTKLLQGVVDRGTARGVRSQGLSDPIAGKTGTTNDRRDSWFAGYSPERATLVWVGYDDNSRTRLSGARAAVPIWARFSYAVRPPGGYGDFRRPESVIETWIDPRTGGVAHAGCSQRQVEYFLADFVPSPLCFDDGSWWQRRRWSREAAGEDQDDGNPLRRWLRRLRDRDGNDAI